MITGSGLKLGIALPQGSRTSSIDVALTREYALEAEAAGFDDLWTIEQITGSYSVLESLTLLSYIAAVTERIRLGTAVLVTNLRNPILLAKEISSLDHLSGGRITVGVGLGANTRMFGAYGLTEERRVARFVEGIRVLKALWTEPSATLTGEFSHLQSVGMEPKPLQKPHPPIWFGAHSEAAQRRAVRFGDGWMGAGSTDLSEFFVELARMQLLLAESGRDASSFPLSKRVYVSINEDEAAARGAIEAMMHDFYGISEPTADAWAVYGSPGRVLDTLQRMRDAGLTHMLLHPAPVDMRHLELIATQIAPQL
ncbi:MAG TPA: LLM class flavin-dependent oxidoreductase [Dehalococcoidia bacterium]|jgi:probable F420-dependent oxidoreductase|nr:LLM class flavin-dependent oxidoreductase [Dehalococcoidia bacterium]